MIELIAIIILFASFIGMVAIAVRKIPALRKLEVSGRLEISFLDEAKKKAKKVISKPKQILDSGFWNVFLQKMLSKIRILSLRIETKCSRLLARTRTKNRKQKEDEKYWDKMSKIRSKKKNKEK